MILTKNGKYLRTASGSLLGIVPDYASMYAVAWNDNVQFNAGNNELGRYNAWCPHNFQYDAQLGKFVFVQCHGQRHSPMNYTAATICLLDPTNPLEYEQLENVPECKSVASFLIDDNGDWYLWGISQRHKSTDKGATWESVAIEDMTRYGTYKIDDVLYRSSDWAWGTYHTSTDMGLTWTERTFGEDYIDGGSNPAKEPSFCKFKGKVYAFCRSDTLSYAQVLRLENDGTWTLVDDSHFLAYQSNCSPVAFDDHIAVAHISREDCHLRYTIWDGKEYFHTKDFGVLGGSAGDFHCPSLAFGNGYAAIAYMNHGYRLGTENSYLSADNMWVIGRLSDNFESIHISYGPDMTVYENVDGLNPVQMAAHIGLDTVYPEGLEVTTGSIGRRIYNNNDVPIIIVNPDNPMLEYSAASKTNNGGMKQMYNGYGVALGNSHAAGFVGPIYTYNGKMYGIARHSGDMPALIPVEIMTVNESAVFCAEAPIDNVLRAAFYAPAGWSVDFLRNGTASNVNKVTIDERHVFTK